MRILHVGKYYYPFRGGIESVVRAVCEGLAKNDHEVEVLCSNDSLFGQEDFINGVKVTRLGRLFSFLGQALNIGLFFSLHKKAKEFDVVHIHGPNPLAELIALTLPKKTKIVMTYHSDVVRQRLLLPFYMPVLRKFLNRVDEIYVATENHVKYSLVLPQFKNKCRIIPFGIDDGELLKDESVIQKAIELRQTYGPFILAVGRLVKYKGFHVLIEAARSINSKIVIVGEGPEYDHLKELISDYNLQDKVFLLGKVEDSTTFTALYHACEIFTLPSITPNENFGIVQLEAMACRKPIVTTNLKSGVPCVGEKGKTCLIVEPDNAEQLWRAIEMIQNNEELKKKMGQAGRDRFENNYTISNMIYLHECAYNNDLVPEHLVTKKKVA